MSQIKYALIAVLVGCVIISLLPYALPVPPGTRSPDIFRFDIVILIFLGLQRIGGGILFLFGLTKFKTAFRHAYYIICAGAMINGFFSLVYPLSRYLSAWQSWSQLYAADIPTAFSFVLMYAGVRKFAGLINLRIFSTSYKWIVPLLFVLEIVLWFTPHETPFRVSELEFKINHAITFIEVFFAFITASLILEIRKVANATYSSALWWFALALIFDVLACGYYMAYDYIIFPYWLPEETIGILYVITGFLLITGGYKFSTMSLNPQNQAKGNSTVDIIVYTAGLASKYDEINNYLEPMRVITARLDKNQVITADQERELRNVYKNLETYLLTKEPLRNYTAESLHEELMARFNRIPA